MCKYEDQYLFLKSILGLNFMDSILWLYSRIFSSSDAI